MITIILCFIKFYMKALYIVLSLLFITCGGKQEKTVPTVKKLSESVYASVTIQPDSLYEAHAVVNGILERNLVDEGALVNKNTPLMHIHFYHYNYLQIIIKGVQTYLRKLKKILKQQN